MSAGEILSGAKGRSRSTPKTFISHRAIGVGELILVGPITPLYRIPTVLKSGKDGPQIEHLREDTSGVGGGIKVVEGIPVILTASHRFAEVYVVKGVGTEVVAPVALPGRGGGHGLTPESNIGMSFAVENHQYVPKEVVVRGVVVQVDVLLLTIVKLRRGT